MTTVKKFWPLLTGIHRYDKSLSTRNRNQGTIIEAPILAYLIETSNGRILYDVGCDYQKVNDPTLRARYYENDDFPFGPPQMEEEQRLPKRFATLGLTPQDIDLVFIGHLHFDHAGGLCEMCHAEIHVHQREMAAAQAQTDGAYFQDDFAGPLNWQIQTAEYALCDGVQAIETPGHTAGHMSLLIELPKGKPILLAGDAADLQENLDEEIAPGLCWNDEETMALESIRKLKQVAGESGAELWPNHDMGFFNARSRFPKPFE
jgi:N-acyl homoserine lactone hydrolase